MKNNSKGLSALGLTMMALGTVIGGSFFLGSAIAIKNAGSSIIISYLIGGGLVYLILFALSEMTIADPAPGSFRTFAENAFGSAVGFVVGWVYWTGLILAMSSEATAVSLFLRIWFPQFSLFLLGSIIIIIVTLLNLLGAERLSKLESGLAGIKLLAIIGFIIIAVMLIVGILPNKTPVGIGVLSKEVVFPRGITGIVGSMLIVMFTYAGFEIIGLASSETTNPHKTVPKAILYTVIGLVGLYVVSIALLLPLIPTNNLTEKVSPFVVAFESMGIHWVAGIMNVILVSAILSTMLASVFGLGRMLRSLVEEGSAPSFLKDKGDVPYKGIIFSGLSMFMAFALGNILPKRIYLFLVSSGGFSLLFTYLIILITHYKFRKDKGCPPKGNCQFPGYPYTSWISIVSIVIIIVTMPLIPGQGTGLVAGLILVVIYSLIYALSIYFKSFSKK